PGRDHGGGWLYAELLGPAVGHHNHRGGAVVERARVARSHGAVLAERGLERRQDFHRRSWSRAVVLGEHLAVGQRHGDDLAVEEAVVAGLHRRVLALHRVTVLFLAT